MTPGMSPVGKSLARRGQAEQKKHKGGDQSFFHHNPFIRAMTGIHFPLNRRRERFQKITIM
jgi:hypothetical protein